MKTLFAILILSLSQVSFGYDDSIEIGTYFEEDHNEFVVVERPYRYLFRKKIFASEVERIEKALELDNKRTKVMKFKIRADQDLFVSRYFKKMHYDAYLQDGMMFIYTNRPLPL